MPYAPICILLTLCSTINKMRCPTLIELPPPLAKIGWPWTEESPQLPDVMPDGTAWPKISIVTPSFNQGEFIEETIRSILLQGYPDLEFFIIDGGSKDVSVEIIKKYEKWLTYWVSEPDNGQTQAINKGFQKATGSITAWLNSDDLYEIESFKKVGTLFVSRNDVDIIYGDGIIINEKGAFQSIGKSRLIDDPNDLGNFFPNRVFQPSLFFKKKILDDVGFLDENLDYAMDVDFWLRAFQRHKALYTENNFSRFRLHQSGKTIASSIKFLHEEILLINRYRGSYDLFVKYLEVYIAKSSLANRISCESAFEMILHDLAAGDIKFIYLEQVIKFKLRIISNSCLLNADFFYNKFMLSKCMNFLLTACSLFPLITIKKKFWHLFLASLFPIPILKYLRKSRY
jgi:glycosyltransferase involved in cell wall biosynthesis